MEFTFPIQSDRARFAISSGLTRLGQRVNVVLRFLPPGGAERAFDVHGDPGIVELDPRWHQAALRFVKDGFDHILDGIDHLLFLFGLVIPFRRIRSLIVVVTSFTIAHSVTLIASAYNLAPELAVVSAARRIADRGLDRLHGVREHRRGGPPAVGRPRDEPASAGAAMGGRVRLRVDPRLRLLVRAARDAAVRRIASADVAAVVQRRRRARSDARARDPRAGAQSSLPLRGRRADRHDHPLRTRRAYRLALGARTRRRAVAVPRGRNSMPR